MDKFISPIEYASNKCLYSIRHFKQRQVLLLEAKALNPRKNAILNINNVMLKQYKLNTQDLVQRIYKQIIHEGNFKKNLLRHQDNTIYLGFDYPNCSIKQISFPCEWIAVEESTVMAQKIALQAFDKHLEERCRTTLKKCEKILDSKTEKLHNTLKEQYQKLIVKLNCQIEQKISQFTNFSTQNKMQLEQHLDKSLDNAKVALINCKKQQIDRLKLIKNGLKTSISTCDSNVKEIMGIVCDLKITINHQQDMINKSIDDFQRRLNEFTTKFQLPLERLKTLASQTKLSSLEQETSCFFEEANCSQKSQSKKQIETPVKTKIEEKLNQEESPKICIKKTV